jgi:dihydrofolate synthase / folylpolyglutamate synthase
MMDIMQALSYREAVEFIFGHTNNEAVPQFSHAEANYDLRRVFQLLERMGNPHLKARSLHITGTNGKGSTSAMLASVLSAAGYRTGLYTSPHLITMRERFNIDGKMISEEEVAVLMTRLKPEIEAVDREGAYGKLTVFEILTVLCFCWFAQQSCDFQVMEVGMGGRYDATNVIQPEVCLLTSISLDHTAILGDTAEKIAAEKCGIIKPGCAVVSHPQTAGVEKLIAAACLEKGVKLIRIGRDIICRNLGFDTSGQRILVNGRLNSYEINIPLLGQYQIENTAAAAATLEVLMERGWHISVEAMKTGFTDVKFQGRMQVTGSQPWIVLDGGHNPGAARCLKEALRQYFKPEQSILVIGMSVDKDQPGVADELKPLFQKVIATRADNPRSTSPEVLAALFHGDDRQVTIAATVTEAIKQARRAAGKQDLICITGSLFVVGEALKDLTAYPGRPD